MKKRRPCSSKHPCSPGNSPREGFSSTFSLRSKSFDDLKRKRLQRGNLSRQQKRIKDDDASPTISGLKKRRDAYGSLQSLFDVKRPLKLPEVIISLPRYTDCEFDEYSSNSSSENSIPTSPKALITDSYLSSNRPDHEPNIILESHESLDLTYKSDVSKLEELAFDIVDEALDQEWDDREGSFIVDGDMANEEEPVQIENAEVPQPSAPLEENSISPSPETARVVEENDHKGGDEVREEVAKPPEYQLPPGVGEGVPSKLGGRSESIISSLPLTDAKIMSEMMKTKDRCDALGEEMSDIRKHIHDLKNKETITDEDTKILQEKQAVLVEKMKEFDEMTGYLAETIGLANPSGQTLAKMYEILPYPHNQRVGEKVSKKGHEIAGASGEKHRTVEKNAEPFRYERFEPPQPEYPEDKLPRAIICGSSEDGIPKIVIPDSRPKGTRCLKNLTGKLSESLNMQEKLVEENAKLEGRKYKLEEALLEKDNTVESLQRKVCSLQAEMRIVVKENTELNHQLSSLSNERSNESPACCFTCPSQSSPRSTNRQQSSYSRASSPRQEDSYCNCKSCMQKQFADSGRLQSGTLCVNPDGYNPYEKTCAASPRLSGGGSRDRDYSYPNSSTEQGSTMFCRGPANVKIPGASMRSGACPAEMENTMATYGNSTNQLAQQLTNMESEIQNMQMELANVHREREQLENQRKLLQCTGPCAPCSCCPPGMPHSTSPVLQPPMIPCVAGGSQSLPSQIPESSMHIPVPLSHAKMAQQQQPPTCSGVCVDAPMGASTCPQQQLRDLREQYARLQEDYRNKVCEVSCLRSDAEKMKQETREAREEREKAENRLVDAQERLKMMESEKLKFHGSKEQLVEQEQALLVAKQRYREAQDELEELRSLIQDQANQLEDYRNKYLQAQEQVEEQRRQLELMEMDNARMNQNVTLEIGKVKNHFLGKLAEFAPLADIVKQTQAKLQEVQQLRLIAERNCEDLTRELLTCKDQLGTMQSQLNAMRSANSALNDEKGMGSGRCEELEKKNSELRNENERMKNTISRLEEQESQLQKRVDEKLHEIVQLTAMLEQVREDSARQVARTKERCETVRRTMQGQIAEMEKQLAQCRATARAAQKDRDEIRQKMQGQINNLNEAFEQAQGRIRSLQGHVNYLKTSYSTVFSPGAQGEGPVGFMTSETAGQGQGYDSCDCNY